MQQQTISSGLMGVISKVQVINGAHKSVQYARARFAIEDEVREVAKSNSARAKRIGLEMRMELVKLMDGKVYPDKKHGKIVKFDDGSQAKY